MGAGFYFQRQVGGIPVSALVLANGRRASILGFTMQWSSPTPGYPFRYGGAVRPASVRPDTLAAMTDAVHRLTAEIGDWLGLDAGRLAQGKRADLVVVDLRKPHLTPALRVVSCFVHQGQASDVEAVMVDGRWVMRDGRVLTLDEPAVLREAQRVARGAWRRLLASRSDLPHPPGLYLGA